MLAFSRRLIYTLSNKIRQRTGGYREEKYTVDFTKVKKSPFDIKAESSYNAYLSNGSFTLGLKKPNCIAWTNMPEHEFEDHVIEAKIQLESLGGYAAAGVVFHIEDDESYYMALVSGKGFFRLDVVKNNSPKTLIAWTDIPDFNGVNINMKIITYGYSMTFLVNGKWLGEINDDSIEYGGLGFALASYETTAEEADEYTCKAHLNFISIDTRMKIVEQEFNKWTDDSNINAEGRLRFAETLAAMDEPVKALEQITRAWKRRDEVIRTVSATAAIRTKKELLFAARLSIRLGQFKEAEEYIDSILDQWPGTAEGKMAYLEKIKILNELNKFKELKQFVKKHSSKISKDVNYYAIMGKCYWELKDYKESANAWDKAFELTKEINSSADKNAYGGYIANAAKAHELAGDKIKALARYIEAGKFFLNNDNIPDLAAVMPKLSALGENNWEARSLAGKWAYSIEDYSRCAKEFEIANKLRCALRPRPKADPALYYLWGMVYHIKGKRKTAVTLLKRAVKLAPDYKLFRVKLEELISEDEDAAKCK